MGKPTTRHQQEMPNDWMFQRTDLAPARQSTDRLPPVKAKRTKQRSRRGWGMKLVVWLMTVTVIAIVLVIGGMLASEALVKPMVADRVEAELNEGVQTFVNQELTAIPAPAENGPRIFHLGSGDQPAHRRATGSRPLDGATAEINDDGIVVHLEAYRMSGTYRAQVSASNGAITIQDGSLSGPLSYVIPIEELERVANEAILSSSSHRTSPGDRRYTCRWRDGLDDGVYRSRIRYPQRITNLRRRHIRALAERIPAGTSII
ncbi:MAG: hypothetical protein R2849_21520 [Thermomicrobiales bacterium]